MSFLKCNSNQLIAATVNVSFVRNTILLMLFICDLISLSSLSRGCGVGVRVQCSPGFDLELENTRFHSLKYSSAKQSSATCQNAEKPQNI